MESVVHAEKCRLGVPQFAQKCQEKLLHVEVVQSVHTEDSRYELGQILCKLSAQLEGVGKQVLTVTSSVGLSTTK